MAICKILQQYTNIDDWNPGDIVDITNPDRLIEEGKVVLIDPDTHEELDKPGTLKCPVGSCSYMAKNALDLAAHIIDQHPRKSVEPKSVAKSYKRPRPIPTIKEGLLPEKALAKVKAKAKAKAEFEKLRKFRKAIEDETVEARQERIRRQRIINLAKARAARQAKASKKK